MKGQTSVKVLIAILVLLILVAGGTLGYKIYNEKNKPVSNTEALADNNEDEEEPQIQIFNGKDRPIAVMIDNHKDAWPQAGLEKAYMVYEIIVEGGETRLMACFKGVDVDKIGPVRSARHYFLDYVAENDAIYTHYGWSPQAEKDITKLTINNLNGISEGTDKFWRINEKVSPHNVLTSTKKILEAAKSHGYRTTSTEKSVLNYDINEVNLDSGEVATSVTIPHSKLHTVRYEYDENTKRYNRYARNVEQKDFETEQPISTKNIIIVECNNSELKDNENKGRQTLDNIGIFDGYYITNGKAIKIQCIKNDRKEKTVYKDLSGNEIKFNDGNTFVQICPTDSKIEIEGDNTTADKTQNTNRM